MMTLEQQILSEALEGMSLSRETVGGWRAWVAKDTPTGRSRVYWFHRNDDLRHSNALLAAGRRYLTERTPA